MNISESDTGLYIDVGSTSVKFASKKDRGAIPFPPPVTKGEIFEVETQPIVEIIRKLIGMHEECRDIFFSVQMHGYVLSSRKNRYVSWRDRRCGQAQFEALLAKYGDYIGANSGTASKRNLPVYSILSDWERGNDIGEEFYSLGSYIAYSLTGNNCSHASDLCASGFYLRNGALNIDLLQALPFRLRLPRCEREVVPCGTYCGKRVYVPIGDQQCSVFGVCMADSVILNVGTAAQLCCVADYAEQGKFENRPYFDGATLCTVTGLYGGGTIMERYADPSFRKEVLRQYRESLTLLPHRNNLLCCGGAFDHYGEFLYGLARELGYEPKRANSDALQGLQAISGRYVCKKR